MRINAYVPYITLHYIALHCIALHYITLQTDTQTDTQTDRHTHTYTYIYKQIYASYILHKVRVISCLFIFHNFATHAEHFLKPSTQAPNSLAAWAREGVPKYLQLSCILKPSSAQAGGHELLLKHVRVRTVLV